MEGHRPGLAAIAANPTLTSLRRLVLSNEWNRSLPELRQVVERFGPIVRTVEDAFTPDTE